MPKTLNKNDPRFIIGQKKKYDAFGDWYTAKLRTKGKNVKKEDLTQVSLYMPTATYNKMINEALIPLSAINGIFEKKDPGNNRQKKK